MKNIFKTIFLMLALFQFSSLSFAESEIKDSCGGEGESPCAYTSATKLPKACPSGSFFDPIYQGSCWTCPSGYNRTASSVLGDDACKQSLLKTAAATKVSETSCKSGDFRDPKGQGECWTCAPHRANSEAPSYKRSIYAVTDDKACIGAAYIDHTKATDHGKGTGLLNTDCSKGQFLDIGKGRCYSCPSGFDRTASSVTSSKACAKLVGESVKEAKFISKEGAQICDSGKGEFFDPRNKGECWTCPANYVRGVTAVTATDACVAVDTNAKTSRASYVQGGYDAAAMNQNPRILSGNGNAGVCGSNGYWDPRNGGECWTCPASYDRSWAPVNSVNACVKPLTVLITNTLENGQPLGCGAGLVDVKGICVAKNVCGKEGQRPCLIEERVPSCNKDLRESLDVCIPLEPGEIGFLSTLGEWNQEVTNVAKEQCFEKLDMLPAIPTRGIGVDTGEAFKYFNIGYACSYFDQFNVIADKANQYNQFRKDTEALMESAEVKSAQKPCSDSDSKFIRGTCGFLTASVQQENQGLKCSVEGLKAIKISQVNNNLSVKDTWLPRGQLAYQIVDFLGGLAEEKGDSEDSDSASTETSTEASSASKIDQLKQSKSYIQSKWDDSKLKGFIDYYEKLNNLITAAGYTTQTLNEFYEVKAVRDACGPVVDSQSGSGSQSKSKKK